MANKMNHLSNQIKLFSLDTSDFFTYKEILMKNSQFVIKEDIKYIDKLVNLMDKYTDDYNILMDYINGLKDETKKLDKLKIKVSASLEKVHGYFDKNRSKIKVNVKSPLDDYISVEDGKCVVNENSQLIAYKRLMEEEIQNLKVKLSNEIDKHEGKRELRKSSLFKDGIPVQSKIVSQFESVLSRTFGIKKGQLTTDIMIVRVYHYGVFKSLMENGFIGLDGDSYEYMMSSAGQVRQKKACFAREKAWDNETDDIAIKDKLTAGLSMDEINKNDGMNPTKYNAYLSLCSTSSVAWEDFNIDKAIVVDDYETVINTKVDYIDDQYTIHKGIYKDIEVNHTDGCGMILPSKSNLAFQCRLPWMKGLLVPFDFQEFARELESKHGKRFMVKDIDGVYHDVQDVEIIFTKSQYKIAKYLKWSEYQKRFKEYECEAAISNMEQTEFPSKPLNYQVLQNLKMNYEDLKELAKPTNKYLDELSGNVKNLLGLMNASEDGSYFQKALYLYNDLIDDVHSKEVIKDTKASFIKKAKAGKLKGRNIRQYCSPDLVAFCEYIFGQKVTGLLKKGQVSSKLFRDKQMLDLMRSPSLGREHLIQYNVINEETEKWFVSNVIYMNSFQASNLVLQMDFDGDELLIGNGHLAYLAKETMKGVNPLYYNLGIAKPIQLDNKVMYDNLIEAYKINIGNYSNLITKIWNTENPDTDLIGQVVFENNNAIDAAKTGHMPKRTKDFKKKLKKYYKMKMPNFFKYAKGYTEDKLQGESDTSLISKLDEIIETGKLDFSGLGLNFDYKKLMKNGTRKIEGEKLERIVAAYKKANKSIHFKVKNEMKIGDQEQLTVYDNIRNELLEVESNVDVVVDYLVKYLYYKEPSKNKTTLWEAFGKEIVRNILKNVHNAIECEDCKKRVDEPGKNQYRCTDCQSKANNKAKLTSKIKRKAG